MMTTVLLVRHGQTAWNLEDRFRGQVAATGGRHDLVMGRTGGVAVIEDVSHAHGGVYKGRKLGTIGHVGAMSCMSGKSFASYGRRTRS